MRSLRLLTALFGVALAVSAGAACSSTLETAPSSSSSSSSSQGGAGGGGAGPGGGGDGGGGGLPIVCTSQALAHAEACPSEPCAITEDVEVFCDDWEFAAPGLRVAPAPDATWLATSSSEDKMVFRIQGGEAVREDASLPASYVRTTMALALDGSGAPHLGVDATRFESANNYPGGVEHAVWDGAAWAISEVYDKTDKYVPLANLDIASDSTPRLWIIGDAPDFVVLASPSTAGGWDAAPVATPAGGGGWTRFTLTNLGQSAAIDFVGDGSSASWQLTSRIDGVESALGAPVTDFFPNGYVAVHGVAPAGAPSLGPALAVAIQHQDSLRVAWPSAASYEEIALPSSKIPVFACVSEWNVTCPGPCHETAFGVDPEAYSVARTEDGSVWVAVVRTQYDWQLHFEESCDEEIGCYCNHVIDADNTTAELALYRLDASAKTATEVLSMPIRPLQGFGLFSSFWSPTPWVDMRGFGSQLAIGLRTVTDKEYDAAVRVLRVDTTLL